MGDPGNHPNYFFQEKNCRKTRRETGARDSEQGLRTNTSNHPIITLYHTLFSIQLLVSISKRQKSPDFL